MAIKLGSNISSLTAQRRLAEADSALSKTFERLSSGQRINRASDDAAGLAIADDLKAKGRIYTQGIRNGNDGISLLNIADSAIDALSGVATRIRELSEQAANGTYSNEQRAALDAEAQALSDEFTRITQTTSLNGIKLFDGSLGAGVRLQLGIGITESVNASVGGAIGSGELAAGSSYATEGSGSNATTLGDLNGDGHLDLVSAGRTSGDGYVTIRLGTGNGSFSSAVSYSMQEFSTEGVALGDLNGDGNLDLVSAGSDSTGSVTIRLGNGNGTFGSALSYTQPEYNSYGLALGDLNGDGFLDLVTTGYLDTSPFTGYTSVRLGNGNGTFGSAVTYSSEGRVSRDIELGDINGDGILDLVTAGYSLTEGRATVRMGTGDGSFGSSTSYTTELSSSYALELGDLNGDGKLDLVTAGVGTGGRATVRINNGDGTFGTSVSYTTESSSSYALSLDDLNGDGILDLITAGKSSSNDGYLTIRLGLGNGSFSTAAQYSTEGRSSEALSLGDLNEDGVLDIVTAGSNDSFNGFATVRLAQTKDGLGTLLNFSLKTKSDALQSMSILDKALENLAKQRGTIGASQSRVNIAISNLQSAKENFAAAESRIRDTDVASEAANLVRTQILQQAAASVLSQANQAPQLALTLLR